MTNTVRMPVSTAQRKGFSALTHQSSTDRVILTSLGRPVAVMDSAERIDEDMRKLREAAREAVELAADLSMSRSRGTSLEEVCVRLGVDVEEIRRRAKERNAAEVSR